MMQTPQIRVPKESKIKMGTFCVLVERRDRRFNNGDSPDISGRMATLTTTEVAQYTG